MPPPGELDEAYVSSDSGLFRKHGVAHKTGITYFLHNISYFRQRRIVMTATGNSTENSAKSGFAIFDMRADRQTDRQTLQPRTLIAILRTLWGQSKNVPFSATDEWLATR